MRVFLLISLCVVATKFVVAEDETEVKRGAFPFMAFVYYPDETVLDIKGLRLTRAAVLIRPDWIITSSLETADTELAFPKKTLLARLGATSIDDKFNLNEDEGEQEREIIVIVRPINFNRTKWWEDDISLMKTLLPFNITNLVTSMIQSQPSKRDISEQSCFIILYAKMYPNATDRMLMQIPVELLPPSEEKCGIDFRKETMICANRNDEKNKEVDPNFCEGNGGGPLMCDNKITGLQTYINDCQQPYLYQLLQTRENLIACATEEKYDNNSCVFICSVIKKDPPVSSTLDNSYVTLSEIIVTESTYDTLSTSDTTVTSIIVTEEENMSTNETEVPKPTMTDRSTEEVISTGEVIKTEVTNTEEVINKTSILTATYSHDTTVVTLSEIYANTDEDIFDPTQERERQANVEAHQIVSSEATLDSLSVYSFIFLGLSFLCLS